MSGLADIQRRFAASILARHDEAADLIAGDGLAPELRLAIHRNNTYASLIEVLSGAFPRLAGMLGKRRFQDAAGAYVAACPPREPRLASYGHRFAAFLKRFPPAGPYPWLAALAELEWARHEVFFAPDGPVLSAAGLARIPPERYGGLRLHLHPAVRLVRSPYPVHRLWDLDTLPTRFEPRQTCVLVMRPELAVLHAPLETADETFLHAVATGRTLDEAAAITLERHPDHDLTAALAWYLRQAVFSDR